MKRIVSFILAVAVIFSNMTGVFAENKKSDKNDFYQSMADKYTEVIKEHSNAANLEDSPTVVQKSADDFKYINGYFYTFEKERMSTDLKYAVVDISGDGTPELIIAEMQDQKYYLSDEPPYLTWDIYGFKDNRIYSFFGDDASERCRFYVMNDGMIKCAGSSGAAIQGFSYYELGKNSVLPKRVKNCSREGNDDGSVYYYEDDKRISESEYDRLDRLYKYKKPTWYSIHDASGIYSFMTKKLGSDAPVKNITKSFDTKEKLEIQNCIKLLHNCDTAWKNNVYDVCDLSALNESDIGNLMIYIAHYYQGFVGESVDYTDEYPEEPICNYVKLSDIYNAAYKYFGIDIDDIYTRLSPEDFKNAPKIFWNCGNPVVKVKGEPCINVGVQIDANFVCVPVIDKIYSLGDDSYYVLYKYWRDTDTMYKPDDEYSEYIPNDWDFSPIKEGYAVIKSRVEKGEKHYYIVNCGANAQSFLSPSELNRYLTISRRPSNIKIDYKKIKSYTKPEQYTEYLEKQLGNTKPNDSAKSEIIKFIEHAVESVANTEIKVKGKKITITAEDIKDAVKKAKELRRAFDKLLSEKDITLNKAVDTVIRIDTKGVALNKGVTVVYDSSLSESFDEISGIKVIYDADRQSVSCDAKSIKKYFDNGEGQVKIIVKDNEYKIEFLDKHGKTVKKAAAQLKFAFRINSKCDTVYYHNGKKKTNWSGQINDADNTIEFQTATSGIYTVEKNEPKISDIDDLTEQQQEAVKFMVSRGYFELENDRFNPYRSLSRYEFTQTLVSIFYALDFDAKTSFSDVKKSSVYYEYVASSEQENIVKGFEDGTFKGNKNTTKEEVISIASRTLAEKKGYIYPENTDEYVQFADNEEIEGWENQYGEIALAVREGLIDKGGILAPKSNITRVEAAVILYRLFNCLYEITPIQTNTKSSSAGFPAGAAAAAGGVAVIGGASAAFVIIRKRKLHI